MKPELKNLDFEQLKQDLDQNGFLVLQDILTEDEVGRYASIYEDFITGKIEASGHRHDLGSHEGQKTKMENITQIMWPSLYMSETIGKIWCAIRADKAINADNLVFLDESPLHQKAKMLAQKVLGEDMDFDFDMLISKV